MAQSKQAIVFGRHTTEGYKEVLKGVKQKTLVFGAKTLMTEFVLQKDSALPEHHHIYEQTGYLVKGHILIKIGDAQYDVHPGDSWCIASNVNHGAQIIEDSVAIEIFAPVREDYIT
jgi:quercetin dioxygenase-like cupin family protein